MVGKEKYFRRLGEPDIAIVSVDDQCLSVFLDTTKKFLFHLQTGRTMTDRLLYRRQIEFLN
jgi:hypothetical protein